MTINMDVTTRWISCLVFFGTLVLNQLLYHQPFSVTPTTIKMKFQKKMIIPTTTSVNTLFLFLLLQSFQNHWVWFHCILSLTFFWLSPSIHVIANIIIKFMQIFCSCRGIDNYDTISNLLCIIAPCRSLLWPITIMQDM